jgi:putative ABC transport system substrate-binding protein
MTVCVLAYRASEVGENLMQRRTLVWALGATVILAGLPAAAQQLAKTARIGYMSMNFAGGNRQVREAFFAALSDIGYIEGRNLEVEYRDAEGKPERLDALAAELVALKVDVILAGGGTLGALAAKRATTAIPIVFPIVGDPVADGLVASLARPGGNVTGLSAVSPDLVGKWFEQLKLAAPGANVVAYLTKPDSAPKATIERFRTEAAAAAKALGVGLRVIEVSGMQDFDRAFSEIAAAGANGLVVQATPTFDSPAAQDRLTRFAAARRLPAIYSFKSFVEAGGLMSYGPDFVDLSRRSAGYVDKILKAPNQPTCPLSSLSSSS